MIKTDVEKEYPKQNGKENNWENKYNIKNATKPHFIAIINKVHNEWSERKVWKLQLVNQRVLHRSKIPRDKDQIFFKSELIALTGFFFAAG